MGVRWFFIGLIFLFISNQTVLGFQWEAESDRFIISNYGVEQGFPTKTITDLAMGKDGYLYLASVNGLIRLDGIHTEIFDSLNNSDLLSERISRIFPLSITAQLIMDHQGMLYRFEKGEFELMRNPESNQPFNVSAITQYSDEAYLVTDKKSVALIYPDTIDVLAPSLSSYEIWDVQYISDSVFLLNTNDLFVSAGEKYKSLEIPDYLKPDLNLHTSLTTIDGHIKVQGSKRSACYNTEEKSWCTIHSFELADDNEEIYKITDHEDDGLLVVTSESMYKQDSDGQLSPYKNVGGIRYENMFSSSYGTVLVHRYGVYVNDEEVFSSNSPLVDAALDNSENIWVSTKHNGVFKISKNKFTNHYNDFLINSYSIARDTDGNYWTGSFDNGLMKLEGNKSIIFTEEDQTIASNSIRMIEPLSEGGVLVSSWGQVPFIVDENKVNPLTEFASLFGSSSNVTESFYEDVNSTWWLGTLNGLMIKEGNEYSRFYDRAGNTISHITRIVPSPFNNELYFATVDRGVVLLRNQLFHFLSEQLPLSSQHIRDVWVQSQDTIWATSYSRGLQRYILNSSDEDPISDLIELTQEDGLMNAGYHRIIPDTLGILWISTNSGLLRVSKDGLNQSADRGYIYTNLTWFTEEDGIVDREFNGGSQSTGFYDEENQRIWFTNIAGLVSFDPYQFKVDSISSSNFSVQQIVAPDTIYRSEGLDNIHLDKDHRNIQIQFAHIAVSDNLTSDIWVKRSDQLEWEKPATPGTINLNNLKSGSTEITFSTAGGKAVIHQIELIIEPKLEERAEFQIIGAFTLIGLLLFIFNYFRDSTSNSAITDNTEDITSTVPNESKDLLAEFIHENYSRSDLGVPVITEELSMSRSTLYRIWNDQHEESISEYINKIRLEKATELLESEEFNITEVAQMTGYSSQSYFTKVFKKQYGIAPSKFKGARANP